MNILTTFYSGGIINHSFCGLEVAAPHCQAHFETVAYNATPGTRLKLTTTNRIRGEPCQYHIHNDSSARAGLAMPSKAVVSPAYQRYPFSSGQYANSRPLPVPNWMMIVHLVESAQQFLGLSFTLQHKKAWNIPESRRSIIREGVPIPNPNLEEDCQHTISGLEAGIEVKPCFLDEFNCFPQLDMLGKEFRYHSVFCLKDTQSSTTSLPVNLCTLTRLWPEFCGLPGDICSTQTSRCDNQSMWASRYLWCRRESHIPYGLRSVVFKEAWHILQGSFFFPWSRIIKGCF